MPNTIDNQVDCSICLCPLITDKWALPCNHIFHQYCLKQHYKSTVKQVDERTYRRLKPKCPLCRERYHGRHIGLQPKNITINIEDLPWGAGLRPRLSRENTILQQARTLSLIEQLVSERNRLARARSAIQETHRDQRENQIQLSILEDHLNEVRNLEPRTEPVELIEISDNESDFNDHEESSTAEPVTIVGHVGRGRHIKYIVEWSDGSRTLNKSAQLEDTASELLATYRRTIRANNTRLCRAKKRQSR